MIKITSQVVSLPDREKSVVEIWADNHQVAEISFDTDKPIIEIYPQKNGEPWKLDFEQVLKIMNGALS